MGITKVPERVIITCDFCSREKQKGKDPAWLLGGRLTYCCDGLDYQGNAVGPGDNVRRDLCDRCYDTRTTGCCFRIDSTGGCGGRLYGMAKMTMLNRLICWLVGCKWESINHRKSTFEQVGDRVWVFGNCDFKCKRCGRVR